MRKTKALISILIVLILAAAIMLGTACGRDEITVKLSLTDLSMKVGEDFTLTATAKTQKKTNLPVKFVSSNNAVATVSDNGKVVAVSAGSAKITASAVDDRTRNVECNVTVEESRIARTGSGEILLKWASVENAVSYDIYRAGSRLGTKEFLTNTTEVSYTDAEANQIKYENYYTVAPKDAEDNAIVGVKWNNIDSATEYDVKLTDTKRSFETSLNTVSERKFVASIPDYIIDSSELRIDPISYDKNNVRSIIKGNFDTDSSAHTSNAANLKGYSITRNIIVKNIYPMTISFETETFGENMYFYDSKYDNAADILRDANRIADAMRTSSNDAQMSAERHALYFKPGEYSFASGDSTRGARIDVGFYTTVAGLGILPTETRIGATVYTPPALPHSNNSANNGTHNFWRSIENFEIYKPGSSTVQLGWAVSQAAPMRRISVASGVTTNLNMNDGGWVSGGFTADVRFNGPVSGGGQQQWYTRNSHFGGTAFSGVGWNNFAYASTGNGFGSNYMTGQKNTWIGEGIDQMKEKPFLYYDVVANEYMVFVPGLRDNALGTSWTNDDPGIGESIEAKKFYFAKPGDGAAKINGLLATGKHIFFTPGMYQCDEPIYVTKEGTVVLGTGLATLAPTEGNKEGAMLASDVSGVTLAGFIVDAHYSSKYLLRVGEIGSGKDHSDNPTFISDVFARVGGFKSSAVNAEVAVDIRSNNVIGDHFWIWLADHGRGVGWNSNTSAFGLVVHGDDVSMHGLFVEHFQKYQTLWMGERGHVYFYQNELPYPVPDQAAWKSHGGTRNGWASFKVSEAINDFYGIGFGCYSTLRNKNILLENAFEAPNGSDGIKLEALYTNNISEATSGILNVLNGVGGRSTDTAGKRIAVFSGGIAKQYSGGKLQDLQGIAMTDEDWSTLLAKTL